MGKGESDRREKDEDVGEHNSKDEMRKAMRKP